MSTQDIPMDRQQTQADYHSKQHRKRWLRESLEPITERYNKAQVIDELASVTGLQQMQVISVLDELKVLIQRHIQRDAIGEFLLSGLVKITTTERPPQKAYIGKSTFTGKPTNFAAKDAMTVVKVKALKGLNDMAQRAQ